MLWLTLAIACFLAGQVRWATIDWGLGGPAVRHAVFADEVRGLGQFTVAEKSTFHLGQNVFIYLELDNVATLGMKGTYSTTCTSALQVFDTEGKEVASSELPATSRQTLYKQPRRFDGIMWKVPEVPAGSYELAFTVFDVNAEDSASARVPF